MGCNYYGRLKPTEELKQEMRALIDANEFDKLRAITPKYIHIGKSSYGWQFIFNHNNWKYFGKSERELRKFLHDCDIIDEYGKEISNIDFWNMVKSKKENDGCADDLTEWFGFMFSDSTDFS
jgi:hypothetical protein